MNKIFLSFLLFSFAISGFSQNVAWNFGTGSTPNANPSSNTTMNIVVSALSRGNNSGANNGFLETTSPSGYTGSTGEYNAATIARTGALDLTANGSAYFEFTLTPDANYNVQLSSINFGTRSTGSGPASYTVRSSLDNYGNDIVTGAIATTSTWTLKTNSGITTTSGNGVPITFRIYGYGGTGTTSSNNWRIDDLALTLSVSSSTPTATISLNTTDFNGAFGNVNVGASSGNSSFTVSGSNLTSDITITPPTGGFEIGINSSTLSTAPITLQRSSGAVAPTIIYARFTPLSKGARSGNITASSTNATSRTVAVSGTGVQPVKLAITAISPASPTVNSAFSVTIQSQDENGVATNVLTATSFSLSVSAGTGMVSGTITGTIAPNTSQVMVSGLMYNTAENGVVLTAARTAGDMLTAGNSAAFNVAGVATQLAFVGFPTTGTANSNITSFTVEARRANNSVDGSYTGDITISIASGTGSLNGTLTKAAVAGVATFNDIKFTTAGNYTLSATANGLLSATSGSITITSGPVMNELVVPQYIGSRTNASTNTTRIPFAFCVSFDNLIANTVYNLKAGLALPTDATNTHGPGFIWNGTAFSDQELAGAFTTNAAGSSGPVWVSYEATGNSTRFGGGQVHNLRVSVYTGTGSNTPQFISTKTITTLDIAPTALTAATTTDDGAFIKGQTSAAFSGKYVLTYDNEGATGNPLSVYQVRTATATSAADNVTNLPALIAGVVTQSATTSEVGDFAVVLPIGANNSNGLRRVEIRNADNTLFSAFTTSNGIWNTTVNTTTIVRREVQTINLLSGTLNNVIVSNSFSLTGSLTVTNNLTLNNGQLTTTATNVLKLVAAATVTGGSNTAYVDGPVVAATNTTAARLLPVGKAGMYKPVTITPATTDASEYTAEYFATQPPVSTLESRIKAIKNNEYWVVNRTGGTASAKVSLNYNSAGATWSNGSSPAVSDVIGIVHLRSSNNTWTQEGGSIVPSNTTNSMLTTAAITNFSPFTFGYGSGSVLPVTIASFAVTKVGTGNILKWKVSTETNLSQYVVERSVSNADAFKPIATIAAANAANYNATDAQPAGYNYYRLQLIDKDGKSSYSKIILVINQERGFAVASVYPTVTTGWVRVDAFAATPTNATIRVINQAGQAVYTQPVNINQAFTSTVDLSRLAKGTYLMQVLAEGYSKTIRLVKQ